MNDEVSRRWKWVSHYLDSKNAGITCYRCGISRPTLRKWVNRYEAMGMDGLKSESRRPKSSPRRKLTSEHLTWIRDMRRDRKLGARRIQSELFRNFDLQLSLATIHKVLATGQYPLLNRKRSFRKAKKRYQRPIPGDRVQMDVCKIAPGKYQYTAIDDCTRWKVLALFSRKTAKNTLIFLEQVVEEMPFPIQRIQTDRGNEFFATEVQKCLMEWYIKFRPIRPASPYLNGKVERTQRTDLQEFYSTVSLDDPDLERKLFEWQDYYNRHRPHGSLGGQTPFEKFLDLIHQTPEWRDVEYFYGFPKEERLQEQNYRVDLAIQKLKRSL